MFNYYVQKEGVYPQGVYGHYESRREACEGAKRLASEDRDSYHDWCVYPIIQEGEPSENPLFSVDKESVPNG